jgi:hypothetical protein
MPIRLRLHRLPLLLILALCLPLAARADDASRHAKAAQMIVLLHTERMVQQASATIMKQVSDAADKAIGPNATLESKARLADVEKKISLLVDAQLGWKAMEPGITDLYAQTFTEQELDAIVAFYKTPAGIALLDKMPQINTQVEQLAHSRLVILQPQINQAFEDFRKSQAPPPSAASPAAAPAASPAPAVSKPK